MRKDVAGFNDGLRATIERRIEQRREKIASDRALSTGLGFPARRRDAAPMTYVAPEIRRKAPIRPAVASARKVAQPEPVFDLAEYEHVLSVISGMVTVMERSPAAFAEMKEEHLRQHFLVQLNGQYEGQATGETFNFEGKTDILVRVEGRNIFIAECKFWDGPKTISDAIDQLLGYATWRDTKVALLVFVRSKDFTAVVSKVGDTVAAHGATTARLAYQAETGFRFTLTHRDDPERSMVLTVLVFHVPA